MVNRLHLPAVVAAALPGCRNRVGEAENQAAGDGRRFGQPNGQLVRQGEALLRASSDQRLGGFVVHPIIIGQG